MALQSHSSSCSSCVLAFEGSVVRDGVVIKLCHAGFSLTLPLQYFENSLYTHCRLMKLFHARSSLPSLVSELLEFCKDEYPQWLFYEDDVRRRNLLALNGDVLAHLSASLPRRSKIRNKSAYIDSILVQLHEFQDIVFEGFVRLPSIIANISLPVNCNRRCVPLSSVYLEAMFGKEVAVMLRKPTCIISARGSEVMVTLDWATVPRNELVQRLNGVSFEDVCNSIRRISLGERQDVSMRSRKACTSLVDTSKRRCSRTLGRAKGRPRTSQVVNPQQRKVVPSLSPIAWIWTTRTMFLSEQVTRLVVVITFLENLGIECI